MSYFNDHEQFGCGAFSFLGSDDHYDQGLGEALMMGRAMKPDPGFVNGSELEMSYAIPRTASCPPAVAAAMAEVARNKGKEAASNMSGRESFKKRKSDDDCHNLKVVPEEKSKDKKIRGCDEEEGSKSTVTTISNNKKGPSSDNNSKASDIPKPDYIHVRARRGQATDSHSLAERVRREKISERMKYLQDLVPGCNKITGKAGMLDEIINYVYSLQRQVEFLSMKLAVINPPMDFDADNYLTKEMFPACTSSVPTIGVSSEMVNPGQVQFNTLGQEVACSGLQIGANSSDFTLRRTISAPVPAPGTLLDSSCLNQNQYVTWDAELQNNYSMEYQQGRSSSPFICQPFTGYVETGHVKLEM